MSDAGAKKLEQLRAALGALALWQQDEDDILLKRAIDEFIAFASKHTPNGAKRGWRPSKKLGRAAFILSKAADHAGKWPEGLLEVIRLSLDVPETATFSEAGPTDTFSKAERCALGYLWDHPDASPTQIGKFVRDTLGKGGGTTAITRMFKKRKFKEHAKEIEASAEARKAKKAAEALKSAGLPDYNKCGDNPKPEEGGGA